MLGEQPLLQSRTNFSVKKGLFLSLVVLAYLNTFTRPSPFSPLFQAVSNQFLILSSQTSCARLCLLIIAEYLMNLLVHTCVHPYTDVNT